MKAYASEAQNLFAWYPRSKGRESTSLTALPILPEWAMLAWLPSMWIFSLQCRVSCKIFFKPLRNTFSSCPSFSEEIFYLKFRTKNLKIATQCVKNYGNNIRKTDEKVGAFVTGAKNFQTKIWAMQGPIVHTSNKKNAYIHAEVLGEIEQWLYQT